MSKQIHVHLPALLRKPVRARDDAKDADPKVESLKRKIAAEETWLQSTAAAGNRIAREKAEKNVAAWKKELAGLTKDASPSDSEISAYIACRKETDKLSAEIEKKEDQGVHVPPALRQKLRELAAKENKFSNEVKQAARAKGFTDAANPAQIEKEIAAQQRLIDAMVKHGKEDQAGPLQRRLKFLKEELDKAKNPRTEDAADDYVAEALQLRITKLYKAVITHKGKRIWSTVKTYPTASEALAVAQKELKWRREDSELRDKNRQGAKDEETEDESVFLEHQIAAHKKKIDDYEEKGQTASANILRKNLADLEAQLKKHNEQDKE